MLCEHCKQKEATTHVKKMVNGDYSEFMLCDECASEMGFSSFITDMHSDFSNLVGSLFSNALPARSGATRCKKCGASYTDILSDRKPGCDQCFETFNKELNRAIRNVHGSAVFQGKAPKGFDERLKKNEEIENLRKQLDDCIKNEEYEKAAVLRDEIRKLEA